MDISTTLGRIVSQVRVYSTDPRPAGAANIRMTFSAGGKAFNPTTGQATVNNGFSNMVPVAAAVGEQNGAVSYLFLATDEQTLDVTIETLDASDNVIYTKIVSNVPLKRNRLTTLTDQMFTNSSASGSFQIETDWLEGNTINF